MSSYRGQWIPGDERGFRSRGHRVHSTGNYHDKPPETEHAGLRRWARTIMAEPVTLDRTLASELVSAMIEKVEAMELRWAIVAADRVHCHALIDVAELAPKETFGRAKQFASFRLRSAIPGKLWGASSNPLDVRDREHFINVINYIADHEQHGAVVRIHADFAPARRKTDPHRG